MEKIYIQTLLHEMKELEVLKTEIENELNKREEKVKAYMQAQKIDEVYGAYGEKAIYKTIISKRFDSIEFRKKFKELYEAYLKTSTNRRFKFSY